MEQTLTLGNPAQKMETLLNVADVYGIPLRQVLDTAMGGQLAQLLQQSHGHHKTPAQLPPEVARELAELRAAQSGQVAQSAEAEFEEFISVNRPFFDDVAEDMEQLLDNGVVDSYQAAYDTAVWRNPSTRARALAMMNGQRQADGIAARQTAAGAISTPAPASLTVPGNNSQVDTTEDAVRAAWNASARGGVG